ncbi:hypothetical protein P3T76_010672 [Phytophthora citrophthora]|uniref:Uncharacterized protein n=1 Tax=Phytophthora citrophthora TaxID=4793 RepID=A0AAD9GBT9_9STRA|nr:hypothetical protein P3T76_010672 [Phytophthora citrophthora]
MTCAVHNLALCVKYCLVLHNVSFLHNLYEYVHRSTILRVQCEHKRQKRKLERLNQHKEKRALKSPATVRSRRSYCCRTRPAKFKCNNANRVALTTPLSAKMDLKDAVLAAEVEFSVIDARDRDLEDKDQKKVDPASALTAKKWVTYLRRHFHSTTPVRALNSKIAEISKKTKQVKGYRALYNRLQEISGMRVNGEVQFLDGLAEKTDKSIKWLLQKYAHLNSIKRRQMANMSSNPQFIKTAEEVLEVQFGE